MVDDVAMAGAVGAAGRGAWVMGAERALRGDGAVGLCGCCNDGIAIADNAAGERGGADLVSKEGEE